MRDKLYSVSSRRQRERREAFPVRDKLYSVYSRRQRERCEAFPAPSSGSGPPAPPSLVGRPTHARSGMLLAQSPPVEARFTPPPWTLGSA